MKEATIHSTPDFSTWKMTQQLSMMWNFNQQKIETAPFAEGNKDKPEWSGSSRDYELGENLAKGQEFEFFGKQVLLKQWGLVGEDGYHDFSIFCNGKWQTFSSDIHKPLILAIVRDSKGKKTVIGATLEATTKKAGGKLLPLVEITRD